MKAQNWIFSISYIPEGARVYVRRAVVGPACVATVETALLLANVSETVRAEIRANATVRQFIEGRLSSEEFGDCAMSQPWLVCIGPVHEILPGVLGQHRG